MLKLVALTLLAIGVNAGHVSQQHLSAPLFNNFGTSGIRHSYAPLSFGKYGYSSLGSAAGHYSSPSYTTYVASSPASYNTGHLVNSGYSGYSYSAPSSYIASAPVSTSYQSGYLPAPLSSGYITSAPISSGYVASAPLSTGYVASAPLSTGYVASAPIYGGHSYASAPVYSGSYYGSSPYTPYSTGYISAAPQYGYYKQQSPVHHVQVVHQPNLKEVTVVKKPQQQIVKVLPAAVHETRKIVALPASAPSGIVPIGHGHRKTIENKVTLEQHKVSPIEEGGNDLAPGHDNNASFQSNLSSHTASAPSFSGFSKDDSQTRN